MGKSLQEQLAAAGLSYDPGVPVPPIEPSPIVPTTGAVLPPDVAARAAQQNAVADTGPQTVAPPPVAPTVGYASTAAPSVGAPTPSPVEAQFARAGGGGGAAKFVNPYANQSAALEAGKAGLIGREGELAGIEGERAKAMGGLGAENAAYAEQTQRRALEQKVEGDNIQAKHAELVKGETSRDYQREFFDNQSTGKKVLSALSSIAGGFFQGWSHLATNPALDAINHQADQYIAQSKNNSLLKIGESKDLYSHFKEQTKDDNVAAALTHSAILEGARSKLEEAAQKTQDVAERGRLADAVQSIDQQRAQWDDAAKQAQLRASAGSGPMGLKELVGIQKTMAETTKLEAEAAKAKQEAGGGGQTKEERAADQKGHITEGLSTVSALQREAAGGELPGTGAGGRLLNGVGSGDGLMGMVARGVRSPEATRTNARLDEVAAATLPENEKGNPKSIAAQRRSLFGKEGPEEVQNGLAEAKRVLTSRRPGAALQETVAAPPPGSFRAL
jgi:hypothetical protein